MKISKKEQKPSMMHKRVTQKISHHLPLGKAAARNTLREKDKEILIPSLSKKSERKYKAKSINFPKKRKKFYRKSSNKI
jgi:hypothetical protein